jgi:hypothetical protein
LPPIVSEVKVFWVPKNGHNRVYGGAGDLIQITNLFRKKKTASFSNKAIEDNEPPQLDDLLPSPDAGPEALYVRNMLLDELELALEELPRAARRLRCARPGGKELQGTGGGERPEREHAARAQALRGAAHA